MAGSVSDEAFARVLNQMGIAKLDQIEAAKAAQADSAKKGVLLSLADVLIQQGIITPAIRQNVEEKCQAQQAGGIQVLGQYKLLKKLGEGGMGAVYLAEDTNVGRQVALKVLPKQHASAPGFLTRFRREAKAAGALNHVNIVGAHTVGEEMGHHFIVMEYCDGESLDRRLKRDGALPWDRAVEVVIQVARGLQHAHDSGFIHRDIKPANIIVTASGVAKILDLGLSKNIGSGEQSFNTQTGVALGTPHYISPEQARGDKIIDGRSDIYSLGATFYHLVTGHTPFEGSTAAVIMTKHLNEQLTNPQDNVEDLPDSVAHVIIKMMAKEPNDRYRDCKELLDDLELVIDGKDPSSHAIDVGKSSVAMPRVARPMRPTGIAQGPRRTAGRVPPVGTRQHSPVARNAEGTAEQVRRGAPVVKYIAIGAAALGALVFILVLSMGGNRDRGEREAQAAAEKQKADEGARLAEEKREAEEARVKSETARLDEERRKLAEDKRKAEEAKLEEEKRKLAEERRKLEEARLAAEAEAKRAETATTKVEAPPAQPDAKVTQPDTKATQADTTVADARATKAQQLFSAVLKETAPLLTQNKFADAIALLERKAKDPVLADAAELLKLEKADVEAVVELRKAAIEALRKQAGKEVTLKKGSGVIKGKVVDDAKRDGITLNVGGPEMTVRADQIHVDDIEQYAPHTGNVGSDLRQRGILYLHAGNVAKAKEYFTKASTSGDAHATSYLDRITALELGETEATALKAWERAEKLFAAKDMKGAKAAYEAFERDHAKTQTAATRAATVRERYEAIEKVLGLAPTLTLDLGGGVTMELVLVKAGEFMMGADLKGEKPIHKVKLSRPFYMAKYETTVAQFRAFAEAAKFQTLADKDGNNWKAPGFAQEDNHPVCLVAWNDAQEFCKWAAKKTRRAVGLPTEAQWEYACRAGTTAQYNSGDKDSDCAAAAWLEGNSDHRTHPVGQKKPNAWGLYDMHGNVREWCKDWSSRGYYSESPEADPPGPTGGMERVLRGGSWSANGWLCRSTAHSSGSPDLRSPESGFRVVVECGSKAP